MDLRSKVDLSKQPMQCYSITKNHTLLLLESETAGLGITKVLRFSFVTFSVDTGQEQHTRLDFGVKLSNIDSKYT